MKNSKVISSGPMKAVRGGAGHMTGQKVGTQKPGVTGTTPTNTGGKFPVGGNGKMVGKQSVKASVAGKISTTGAKAGNNTGRGGGKRGDGSF